MSEVLLYLCVSHRCHIHVKSGVYINACNFRSGAMFVNRKKQANDVPYHEEQYKRLNTLIDAILKASSDMDEGDITRDWLTEFIDRRNHPERYTARVGKDAPLGELAELYIKKRDMTEANARIIRVMVRSIYRYQGFRAYNEKRRQPFMFDIHTVTKDDIEDFMDYFRNENELYTEYPALYKKLLSEYPADVKTGTSRIWERGGNYIVKTEKRLKAFFNFLRDEGLTDNNPFEGIKIDAEKYGTPIYINIAERNHIAACDMGSTALETQRDIFIFQCLVGCRVSDLQRLTPANVADGLLTYTPHKTKDEGEQATQARVPLLPQAQALIDKYKGRDRAGRLFPCIAPQKYNDAIKRVFTVAGVTRNVEVRNHVTGEFEMRPINTIASSHLARRTFCGNMYFKVSDPALIGAMSGHVEGSKAFARYRKIETESLKNVIDLIG